MSLKVRDLLQIVPDIDEPEFIARDFMLVRQSDMGVSYIPELPGAGGAAGEARGCRAGWSGSCSLSA